MWEIPAARPVPALTLALALGLLAAAGGQAAQSPGAGPVTGRDLKAIRYVENAHGQLEEWTDRLLARLELGLGPREPEPILDGRADLQTAKIRVTYSGYVRSEALAELFGRLSAAHVARLDALRARLAGAPRAAHEAAYREADARIADLVSRIRNWRTIR